MAKAKKTSEKPQGNSPTKAVERREDGTIVLNITVPAAKVDEVRGKVITELIKEVEAPGFRKGQVPRDIAEAKLSREKVKEEVLKKVLTDEYIKKVKEENITPIINPKVHIEQFEEGTDIKFTAETCEAPKIELGNYKTEVSKIEPEAPKIIVPGQKEPEQKGTAGKKLDKILEVILKNAKITIPKILIDNETNRLLSQMYEEIKKLGMTLEQYLSSSGKTEEALRSEYDERAEKDLKLEFILRKVADDEKITVEEQDVKAAFESIKDEKQKAELSQNPYLVAAIIRQQKTLDFLSKL